MKKRKGHEAVICWLSDGQLHYLDDYKAPAVEAIHAAELAGMVFTRGSLVRLTARGLRKAAGPDKGSAKGPLLEWPWRWSVTIDDAGHQVPVACGPISYPDTHLDRDTGDLVLQYAYIDPRRLPLAVVVALLRRHGYRVQSPQRKHQRGKARRRRLHPASLAFRTVQRQQYASTTGEDE